MWICCFFLSFFLSFFLHQFNPFCSLCLHIVLFESAPLLIVFDLLSSAPIYTYFAVYVSCFAHLSYKSKLHTINPQTKTTAIAQPSRQTIKVHDIPIHHGTGYSSHSCDFHSSFLLLAAYRSPGPRCIRRADSLHRTSFLHVRRRTEADWMPNCQPGCRCDQLFIRHVRYHISRRDCSVD